MNDLPLFDPSEEASKLSDKEVTHKIYELLQLRHPTDGMGEWATFREMNTGTGSRGGRFIDFYAMNLWPSKKYLKIAYEVKVSRADFSKELANPAKREGAERVANECYFVVPSGLLQFDEIPQGWGMLVMHRSGLKCVKKAMYRDIEHLPEEFVMSLARRVTDKPVDTQGQTQSTPFKDYLQERKDKVYKVVLDELGWAINNDMRYLRQFLRLHKKTSDVRQRMSRLLDEMKDIEEAISRPGNENE